MKLIDNGGKFRLAFLIILPAILFQSLLLKAQERSLRKPHIILFLVDDMGWQDTSVPFWDALTAANRKFHTPHMEKLAAHSTKFTEAYANSIYTPSKVSLMTGMNAAHHKVTSWTMYRDRAVDPKDSILEIPDWNVNGLSPVRGIPHAVYATPLFQVLKGHGHFTIHCGKAHFGADHTPGADPVNLGADINVVSQRPINWTVFSKRLATICSLSVSLG